MALKLGVALVLRADGGVEITGKLDSTPKAALAFGPKEEADAEDAERWFEENCSAGRQ